MLRSEQLHQSCGEEDYEEERFQNSADLFAPAVGSGTVQHVAAEEDGNQVCGGIFRKRNGGVVVRQDKEGPGVAERPQCHGDTEQRQHEALCQLLPAKAEDGVEDEDQKRKDRKDHEQGKADLKRERPYGVQPAVLRRHQHDFRKARECIVLLLQIFDRDDAAGPDRYPDDCVARRPAFILLHLSVGIEYVSAARNRDYGIVIAEAQHRVIDLIRSVRNGQREDEPLPLFRQPEIVGIIMLHCAVQGNEVCGDAAVHRKHRDVPDAQLPDNQDAHRNQNSPHEYPHRQAACRIPVFSALRVHTTSCPRQQDYCFFRNVMLTMSIARRL